jgi:hypothetical protein
MKHSSNDGGFQTNILQALQKNKVIQSKLTECEHSYYTKLIKDIQGYNLKEKYNRELLYTWKKESYVRQLRKNLQEYERKRFGKRDAYYEYQVRNLGNIIAGQQGLVIPPSEEERRLNVNAKYQKFIQSFPPQSSSMRVAKSANIPTDQKTKDLDDDDEDDDRGLETTWKHIHAQSAVISRRKQNNILPTIQRSATTNEIRRRKVLAKSLVPPTVAIVSSVLVTTTPDAVKSPTDEKTQKSPTKPSPDDHIGLPDGVEPLLITSETLEKYTRADLVTMRSVRRPRQNPSDLNLLFETRKRIYQINKRALDFQGCSRKFGLQNIQIDRLKQIDSPSHEETSPIEINDKQPSEKIII